MALTPGAWQSRSRRLYWRRARPLTAAASLMLLFLWYWRTHQEYDFLSQQRPRSSLSNEAFRPLQVTGYINTGATNNQACVDTQHPYRIGVEQSFHVEDDLLAIAAGLKDHPRIDYSGQDSSLTHEEVVSKTWLRMAQSSVWLDKYQVYLTITRIIFYDKGVRHWAVISFLRGQIHDKNWKELHDYSIQWGEKTLVFPLTFDIPTPYTKEGGFYGPEDPRIIVEHDVPDAEPVILFNMVSNVTELNREMYIFRPFTGHLQLLSLRGGRRGSSEKNWMPFFYRAKDSVSTPQEPDRYLHFVYYFNPLKVLKCDLLNGECDFVYTEDDYKSIHEDKGAVMRGGTNFYPVTLAGGKRAFVGFPRTHADRGCKDGFYRPELMILTAASDGQFLFAFASESLSFDDAVMNYSSVPDPCADGRILILNSIADWDMSSGHDVMTVTLSVNDYTTQVMRLGGVLGLIKSLSNLRAGEPLSTVSSKDVLGCSVESALDYSAIQYGKSAGYRARKGMEQN